MGWKKKFQLFIRLGQSASQYIVNLCSSSPQVKSFANGRLFKEVDVECRHDGSRSTVTATSFLGLYCVCLLQSLAMPGSVHGPISILFGFCVILLLYVRVCTRVSSIRESKKFTLGFPDILCQTAVFSIELVENHVIVDGSSLGWTITIIQLWGREKKGT